MWWLLLWPRTPFNKYLWDYLCILFQQWGHVSLVFISSLCGYDVWGNRFARIWSSRFAGWVSREQRKSWIGDGWVRCQFHSIFIVSEFHVSQDYHLQKTRKNINEIEISKYKQFSSAKEHRSGQLIGAALCSVTDPLWCASQPRGRCRFRDGESWKSTPNSTDPDASVL